MGCVKNISADSFPKQSKLLNARVKVCFHYDTTKTVNGIIVRSDSENPGVEIIRLDDGRYILTTECQYSFINWEEVCSKNT